ncbi:hypothetical protein FOZ63_033648 [Perkinsus olseni]|uniref:Uncharacterized protein n=2 Tax=Perkinsus olseni TaxID=32597 RepID=A0A7J6PRA5_PEROL|nr:hypothetical protein FOZ63_033648 [Perkinsus olseni]
MSFETFSPDLGSVLALYFAPTRSKTKESVHFFVDQAVEFVARDGEPPLTSVVALLEEDDSLGDFFFKRIVPQKNGDLRCPCRWYSKKEDGDHYEEVIGLRTVTSNKKLYRFGDSYQCFPRYFPGGIFLGRCHEWRLSAIRRCPSDKEIVLVGIRVTPQLSTN